MGLALLFLPFTGVMARVIERVLPDRPEGEEGEPHYRPLFLDKGMLDTPVLALNLAREEILRMGEKVREMAIRIIEPFVKGDLGGLDELHTMEEEIDVLDEEVSAYLLDIMGNDLNEEQAAEAYLMMHVTKQLENIADIVDEDLRPLALRMVNEGVKFSESGRKEVVAYHVKVSKQISRALTAFREGSLEKAKRMTTKQARYVALEGESRQAHFERIRNAVEESVATSEIHLELMDCMRRINSYTANVARAMLAQSPRPEPKEA